MPEFSITPVDAGIEPDPGDLVSFLQFQLNGTDLGEPDVDTVNFTTGLVATRGTGEDANVVTVRAKQPIGISVVTTASYTVLATDADVIVNFAGTCTLTMPSGADAWAGRRLRARTVTANAVISADANVTARTGLSGATPILPATDGAWAELVYDGALWQAMAGS